MSSVNKQTTFIDLFSGCGGLSLGFEQAGFRSLLAIDNWKDALNTYSFNRKNAQTLCADISAIDPLKIKRDYAINTVDAIIGGPPCQGFSVAGKRIIDDDRNKLYKSFVKFVEIFLPKIFVMENVPNILNIGEGLIKDSILHDFARIGYNVTYKVLTASDYGVPQNRRRAIFVGVCNNKNFNFPKISTTCKITAKEAISDLPENSVPNATFYPSNPEYQFQRKMRKNSIGIFNHEITNHSEQTKHIISLVPDGGNYKDLPKDLQGTRNVHIAWTRLNSNKPSFTIDTGHRHHFHYSYNRIPTVRECARLQSFPDNFIFLGSKTSQYKQVGNAVPPLLAKTIAYSIRKLLAHEVQNS